MRYDCRYVALCSITIRCDAMRCDAIQRYILLLETLTLKDGNDHIYDNHQQRYRPGPVYIPHGIIGTMHQYFIQ